MLRSQTIIWMERVSEREKRVPDIILNVGCLMHQEHQPKSGMDRKDTKQIWAGQ